MRLLLSMCNLGVYNSQFSLALVEPAERPHVDLVDCRSFINPPKDGGINGLCRVPQGMAVAIQSQHPRVAILSPELEVIAVARSELLADLHSLFEHEGRLFCVCTGNNKILEIDPSTGEISVFWEYVIDDPCLHINALAFHNGRPLVCCHTVPAESRMRGRGAVWYLDDYEVLMAGLEQPHSLTVQGDVVTCLSSLDSRVVVSNGGQIGETHVRGYLRGLLIDGEHAYIGSSSRRFVSRKQKGVHAYVDFDEVVGNKDFMSSVVVCDLNFKPVQRINTTHLGFEIYDIIPDPGVPEELKAKPSIALRMQTMYRQSIFFQEEWHKAGRKAARLEAEVNALGGGPVDPVPGLVNDSAAS